MLKLLVWFLIGYVVYRSVKGKRELPHEPGTNAEETFRDPVCGVYVPAADAVVGTLDGERIRFCSLDCLEKFRDSLATEKKKTEEA